LNVNVSRLILHAPSLAQLQEHFAKLGRTMVESNKKQAYFPEGSRVIPNHHGTAPGCMVEKDGKILVLVPGPPSEMKPMLEESILPILAEKSEYRIISTYLHVFGVGESLVEQMLIFISPSPGRINRRCSLRK
jgi:nicotinamide-nucleotide amidase